MSKYSYLTDAIAPCRVEADVVIPGREVIAIATPQIEAVIDRLSRDRAFRVKYCQDPDGTLEAYHLTSDEIRAIKTGDDRLMEFIDGNKWEDLVHALCGPNPGP